MIRDGHHRGDALLLICVPCVTWPPDLVGVGCECSHCSDGDSSVQGIDCFLQRHDLATPDADDRRERLVAETWCATWRAHQRKQLLGSCRILAA